MDAVQLAADRRIARIARAYHRATRELTQEAEHILGTYAKRFGLTREEAQAALDEPFDEDSRAYGYRMTRSEALRNEAQAQAETLRRVLEQETAEQREYAMREGYRRASAALKERMGGDTAFAQTDTDGLWRAMGTNWKGASYSDRIWSSTSRLADMLRDEITAAYISGKSNASIEQTILNRFGCSFREAERLVRTETSYVNNQAALKSYEDAQLEEYEYLTAEDSRTCKICAGMNGKRFKLSEARVGENMPPLHPNCRCTVVPVVESALDGLTKEEAQEWAKDGASEDVQEWLRGKRGDGTITPDTKEAGSAGVRKICDLDVEKIRCISPTIDTPVLVLTDERISHIAEGHPGDYEKYGGFILEVAENPDFIMSDARNANTAIYIKHMEKESVNLRLNVRCHVQGENAELSNSILTFQQIRDQEYRRLRKKTAQIVYTND
ncbi:MAG: minor capsid protein [Eubacteriales bacterium]|nr:minor capsid protein [Eubacteriales bacterium]